MRELTTGLHVHEVPQTFFGVEVGARMTVLDTNQGLLLHSPVPIEPEAVHALGKVRWVVAPNKFHHLYIGPWIERGIEAWAAPGLPEKRPDLAFTGILDGSSSDAFGSDIAVIPLTFFPTANEVVLLHRPSRTLVVTDLVFHFTERAPWSTRLAMRMLLGYPGCRMTLLERVGFRRSAARKEIAHLLALDFDRLIMAHGEVIETNGRDALYDASRWLGPLSD